VPTAADNLHLVLATAAIAPALLILASVAAADREPEPPRLVWATFALGFASTFLLRYARVPFDAMMLSPEPSWLGVLARAFVGIAAPEEAVKLLVIAGYAARHRAFDERMDGIVYGAAAGLGFAACENIGYLFRHPEVWETLAALRGLLTVPFHAALGAIAGSLVATAKLGGETGKTRAASRLKYYALAWLLPVCLHGLYDFPLLAMRTLAGEGSALLVILPLAGLAIGVGTIAGTIQLARRVAAEQRRYPGMNHQLFRWLQAVCGGASVFAGAALVIGAFHDWQHALLPDGALAGARVLGGIAAIAAGALLYHAAARHLATR
jgi:RsiW-degrading membrane proteinase PrsW (M82 family)